MSKITKENILDSIDFDEDEWSGKDGGGWSTREIKNAMVAAYNRGIEDAAKSVEMKVVGKYGQLGIDRDSILKLKI